MSVRDLVCLSRLISNANNNIYILIINYKNSNLYQRSMEVVASFSTIVRACPCLIF